MPIPKSKTQAVATNKDRAYQQIRDWIIDGTLEPGEKLAETALAEAVGISRTPVREAMLRLDEEGLVLLATGKVTQVAPLPLEEAPNLFLTMSSLQGLAAAQAVQQTGPKQVAILDKLQANYKKALASGKVTAWLKADLAFHDAILQWAGNPYLLAFSHQLFAHISRLERHFDGQRAALDDQHANIIAAFKGGQALEAKSAMESDWLQEVAGLPLS